jgi:hypothetical protein
MASCKQNKIPRESNKVDQGNGPITYIKHCSNFVYHYYYRVKYQKSFNHGFIS